MAIYFPMSEKLERIVRLVPNEVVLLNSREKVRLEAIRLEVQEVHLHRSSGIQLLMKSVF